MKWVISNLIGIVSLLHEIRNMYCNKLFIECDIAI